MRQMEVLRNLRPREDVRYLTGLKVFAEIGPPFERSFKCWPPFYEFGTPPPMIAIDGPTAHQLKL